MKLWQVCFLLIFMITFLWTGKVKGSDTIYEDLNGDGKVDAVHMKWNGKDTLVIDEGGSFLWKWQKEGIDVSGNLSRAFSVGAEPPIVWNPARADWGSYLILVDVDGDDQFGSRPGDFYCRVVDLNGNGVPEIEYFCAGNVIKTIP